MQWRTWTIIGLVVLALLLANVEAIRLFAGILLLLAIIVALTWLPWAKWFSMPPMRLFVAPASGQSWCTQCGGAQPKCGCKIPVKSAKKGGKWQPLQKKGAK